MARLRGLGNMQLLEIPEAGRFVPVWVLRADELQKPCWLSHAYPSFR